MWALLSVVAAASPVTPGGVAVRFDDALAAVDRAADVQGAADAARVRADGAAQVPALSSNPQLLLQPGLRSERGTVGPEAYATLSQSFNLGGLAAARRAVAAEEARALAHEVRLLRRERRVATAHAWLDSWAAQQAADVAHAEEEAAKELAARLEQAARSGGVTRVELATARAFAAEAAALHLEWEGRRVEAGAQLSTLLGLDELAFADGPLPALPSVELARAQASAFPEVQAAAAQVQAERARADESSAQWATQLQVQLQGGHEAPTQWYGNLGVGVTLPVWERGQRERNAHAALSRRLEGARAAATRAAGIALKLAAHEVDHTAEVLAVVKGAQLPAAEEAAALEARRFAQGETTLLELTLLRRQALVARIAAIVAEARAAAARAHALELLEAP